MANTTTIRLENRTQSKWYLPLMPKRDKDGNLDPDAITDLVLGDMRDTDRALEERGITRDPKLCPSPVVRIGKADLERLTPESKRTLTALVERGDITSPDM